MKASAVQCLVNYLEENFHLTDESFEIMEKAKLMERWQIIEAKMDGMIDDEISYLNAKRYYEEKYGFTDSK